MIKIKKVRIVFSIYFWKQVYSLIASFLTGNVWAMSRLGSYENIDINPTARFGNYPENIFFKITPAARVACPHNLISISGVNQRILYPSL